MVFDLNKTLFSKNLFDIINFLNISAMSMGRKETAHNLVLVTHAWFAMLMEAVLKFQVISFYVTSRYYPC